MSRVLSYLSVNSRKPSQPAGAWKLCFAITLQQGGRWDAAPQPAAYREAQRCWRKHKACPTHTTSGFSPPQQGAAGPILHRLLLATAPRPQGLLHHHAGRRPVAGAVGSKPCEPPTDGRAVRSTVRHHRKTLLPPLHTRSTLKYSIHHTAQALPSPVSNFLRNSASTARVITMSGCSA